MVDKYRFAEAQRRVQLPATALILTGCLGLIGNLVCLSVGLRLDFSSQEERPVGTVAPTSQRVYSGAQLVVGTLINLAIYPVVIFGGVRMLSLKSYRLAVTAAILALLPCPPACVIGIPTGIWALLVLNYSEVRTAFGR